jgi:hypothetical protein
VQGVELLKLNKILVTWSQVKHENIDDDYGDDDDDNNNNKAF